MEIATIIDTREFNGDASVINLKGKIINNIDIKEQKKMEKERLKDEKTALKEKEKAEKLAIKEREKEEKVAIKEKEKAEKIAAKEKEKAEKIAAKEKGKIEKQLKEKKGKKDLNKKTETKKKGRPRIEYNVKILANSQEIKSENEESNEEMYEYLEEEEYCIQIEVDGIKYYKDRNGIIYDFDTHVEI